MSCAICRNGKTHSGHVTVTVQRGETTVILKQAPADVCDNCGEYYLLSEVAAQVTGAGRVGGQERSRSRDLEVRPLISGRWMGSVRRQQPGGTDDRFLSSVGEGLRPAEFHEIPGAMWGRLAGRQPAGRLSIGPRGDCPGRPLGRAQDTILPRIAASRKPRLF